MAAVARSDFGLGILSGSGGLLAVGSLAAFGCHVHAFQDAAENGVQIG